MSYKQKTTSGSAPFSQEKEFEARMGTGSLILDSERVERHQLSSSINLYHRV